MCGGTGSGTTLRAAADGLSPRVRGNLGLQLRLHIDYRSIPACAGEPEAKLVYQRKEEVYPRVCGGTVTREPICCVKMGLSPRVRGNPHRCAP